MSCFPGAMAKRNQKNTVLGVGEERIWHRSGECLGFAINYTHLQREIIEEMKKKKLLAKWHHRERWQ